MLQLCVHIIFCGLPGTLDMVSLQRESQKYFRVFGKLKRRKKKPQKIQEGGEKRDKERIGGLLSILFLETEPMGIRQQGRVFIKHNKRPLCSHACAEQMSTAVLGRIT